MKIVKLNKFERVAGLFIGLALVGIVVTAVSSAIRQGWLESRSYYHVVFENADGIRQGTAVQMSGLRAGAVDSVDLTEDNRIKVQIYVLSRYKDRIRTNSFVQLVRPFIIGERVLDLTVGDSGYDVLPVNSQIAAVEGMDLMSIMGGKNMNLYLSRMSNMMQSMQVLLEAFADKNRAESLVRVFDSLDPLVQNLNSMSTEMTKLSKQATHDQGVKKLVSNLARATEEMNKILPELNQSNPDLARDLGVMTQNLAKVTKALGPAMEAVEPQLPQASQKLVEMLTETVVVLKAMQKNFFMRSSVQEVLQEESSQRLPATEKSP